MHASGIAGIPVVSGESASDPLLTELELSRALRTLQQAVARGVSKGAKGVSGGQFKGAHPTHCGSDTAQRLEALRVEMLGLRSSARSAMKDRSLLRKRHHELIGCVEEKEHFAEALRTESGTLLHEVMRASTRYQSESLECQNLTEEYQEVLG